MRYYEDYRNWEDFRAGMYVLPSKEDEDLQVRCAVRLLSKPSMFYAVALRMIDEWPVSARVHLSNTSRNRQAWIGQASCCFAYGCPEHQTKDAWHRLSLDQQSVANKTADEVIEIWEKNQCPNLA